MDSVEQKNPLHVSAEQGHTDVVQELLKAKAIIDQKSGQSYTTALHFASQNGQLPVMELLLNERASVDLDNSYGNSPLHTCCRQGSISGALLLLERGASVTKFNRKGSSPLHFLCYDESPDSKKVSLARNLIQHCADVNARDMRGMTPLLIACATGRVDLIRVLIGIVVI